MFEKCGQNCLIERTDRHPRHDCRARDGCPFECFFGDRNKCSSLDHFHHDKIENVDPGILLNDNFLLNEPINIHLCGAAHVCRIMCQSKGVCNIKTKSAPKLYKNIYNEFVYNYVDLIAEKKSCKFKIESNCLFHAEKEHFCPASNHICDQRCPDCNCFCDLEYGHDGFHKSGSHRNKECSEYISTEEFFNEMLISDEKKTAITVVAGDSASPEICDQYCIRKGRGHTHPMPCKGEDHCLEKTDAGFAMHSSLIFKSGQGFSSQYDLVTCDTYWKKNNWIPPVETINSGVQKLFSKCNFACGHSSHGEEKVFCEGSLFHSMSSRYSDHNFKCVHQGSDFNDIVFVIDCTGSMDSYIIEVKKVIENLLKKWGNDSNKFAFIGYTDHHPNNGIFPKENPVTVFPHNKILESGNASEAGNFIVNVKTSGGGGNGGEAMIDGLAEANKLNFRKGANRIYILAGDENPHGREFSNSTEYPNGCPCGHNWKTLLNYMKANNTTFIFVKLNESLNKTIQEFNKVYEGKMIEMLLNKVSDFESKVTNTVISQIEKNYVFSKKLRE